MDKEYLKGYLVNYVGSLRALQLWFHSAHVLAKGTGFAGDHVDLYGRMRRATRSCSARAARSGASARRPAPSTSRSSTWRRALRRRWETSSASGRASATTAGP